MWYPTVRRAPAAGSPNPVPRVPHAVSRRRLMRTAAALPALSLAASPWFSPLTARAAPDDTALPIPGGNDFLSDGHFVHVYVPAFGAEPSTVANFNGFVAAAEIQGSGTGTDTTTGATTRYYYDADMRIMDGEYIGADGRVRHGTFGFV